MEITQEHRIQIREIISDIVCPKDFECYKSGFDDLCKVKIFLDGELVECLVEISPSCKLSFNFGFGHYCKCPLMKYIAKNFNR